MTRTFLPFDKFVHTAARVIFEGAVALLVTAMLYSQETDGAGGLVDCAGTVQPAGGAVAIELDGQSGMPYRADIDASGYFRLGKLPPGEYRGRVLGAAGNVIDTIFVSVSRGMPLLALRITEVRHTSPFAGTVSVAVLQHKIPPNAQKEMELALRAAKKKDNPAAIDHLRKAVAIDPEFMDAHNNLGVRYIYAGQNELAVAEFGKALAMDPRNAAVEANTAVALLGLHRPVEAEKAARRSVELNGANARAHYLVALSLLQEDRFTPEVETQLREAAQEIPGARLMLGMLLVKTGQVDKAIVELKAYLPVGSKEERPEVQAWLKKVEENRRSAECAGVGEVGQEKAVTAGCVPGQR